jgi:cardiolipin synthase
MLHCKVTLVDEVWVSVGSTNFDNRSFRLNEETNLNVFDAGFAAEQAKDRLAEPAPRAAVDLR